MSDSSGISILWYALQRNEFLFPILMALLLAALFGRGVDRAGRFFGRGLSKIAHRPVLSGLLVFLLVIAIRLALLPWVPVPSPQVHDEFSQLLLGDTLAHGQVTNPPSPMWVHFETFHVNMLPTYQSMYMPGQGIFLAAGIVLFNSAYAGVLLSVGMMCAAYLWAFRGWIPPKWAMLGALLTILRYCSADYWVNSYWGGAVAATGGALVLGAYPRLWKHPRRLDGVLFAFGLLLMANTRPYEGLLFAIPFLVMVLFRIVISRAAKISVHQFATAGVIVLGLGFVAMMFYCWRSTGNPLRMPYSVNQEQYHPTRPFVWQGLRDVHYNHPMMQRVYSEWEMKYYEKTRTISGWAETAFENLRGYPGYFVQWLLLPFLVGLFHSARDARLRIPVLSTVLMLLGATLVIWQSTIHYVAPAATVFLLLVLSGFRVISTMLRRHNRFGLRFTRAYVVVYAALLIWTQVILVRAAARHPYSWGAHREQIIQKLSAMPGKHVVLVRYGPTHNLFQDWVYNGYDLENGTVLWAREMQDPAKNEELLHYFAGRQFWLLEADKYNAEPVPYPAAK